MVECARLFVAKKPRSRRGRPAINGKSTCFGTRVGPAHQGRFARRQQFKFTRNDPLARRLFGDYYIIDLRTHVPILEKDIEQLGRDLGVLKPVETLK